MATEQGSGKQSPKPFLAGADRPDVHTLLDKPIRDLTPRQLAEVFAALGMPSGPLAAAISQSGLEGAETDPTGPTEPTEPTHDEDPCLWDMMFEREQLLAELVEAGAPIETLEGLEPDELLAVAANYEISVAAQGRLGVLKRIFDKARRDKPSIDKGIKDGKAAADKFIRDGKSQTDKVLSDGKTWVDKQLSDKGRVKDALDAKDIKDMFEGSVTPTNPEPNTDELAQRVEKMRAEFERLSKDLDQLR
jgi:hypothetical protein